MNYRNYSAILQKSPAAKITNAVFNFLSITQINNKQYNAPGK